MRRLKGCLIVVTGGTVAVVALVGFVAVVVLGAFHTVREKTFAYGRWDNRMLKGICSYVLPESFTHRQYMYGETKNSPRWGVQVFTRDKQQIIFLRTPYHDNVDPGQNPIRAIKKPLGPTLNRELIPIKNYAERDQGYTWTLRDEKGQIVDQKTRWFPPKHPADVHFFDAAFYIPFFYRSLPADSDHTLLIRGFNVEDSAQLQTERIRAWIWYGDFEKLGLDKTHRYFLFRPVVLVLEFPERKSGAVAIVKDKGTGDTFITLTTVSESQKLDRKEFESFLKTITFDTEPFDLDGELRAKLGDRFKTKTIR